MLMRVSSNEMKCYSRRLEEAYANTVGNGFRMAFVRLFAFAMMIGLACLYKILQWKFYT